MQQHQGSSIQEDTLLYNDLKKILNKKSSNRLKIAELSTFKAQLEQLFIEKQKNIEMDQIQRKYIQNKGKQINLLLSTTRSSNNSRVVDTNSIAISPPEYKIQTYLKGTILQICCKYDIRDRLNEQLFDYQKEHMILDRKMQHPKYQPTNEHISKLKCINERIRDILARLNRLKQSIQVLHQNLKDLMKVQKVNYYCNYKNIKGKDKIKQNITVLHVKKDEKLSKIDLSRLNNENQNQILVNQ